MARYAGKLSGLYPEDALKALKVDEVVEAVEDTINMIVPSMRVEVCITCPCEFSMGLVTKVAHAKRGKNTHDFVVFSRFTYRTKLRWSR